MLQIQKLWPCSRQMLFHLFLGLKAKFLRADVDVSPRKNSQLFYKEWNFLFKSCNHSVVKDKRFFKTSASSGKSPQIKISRDAFTLFAHSPLIIPYLFKLLMEPSLAFPKSLLFASEREARCLMTTGVHRTLILIQQRIVSCFFLKRKCFILFQQ